MTGKELFERYGKFKFGTPEFEYYRILATALRSIGEERLYKALEQAEAQGKKIELIKPTDVPDGTHFDDVNIAIV